MPASVPPAAANGHAATPPAEHQSPPTDRPKNNDNLRLFRLGTLFALMLMNGVDTVLRRYSQGILRETYSVNEVLMVAECLKMTFSAYMISRFGSGSENGGGGSGSGSIAGQLDTTGKQSKHTKSLSAELIQLLLQSRKMLILVMLYGAGNWLSYYALARIGAGSFVVIANLKTLSTAAFSVLLLGRTYSWTQWRALILLVCGVVLFVLPTLEEKARGDEDEDESSGKLRDIIAGCLAELVVVTISGFAAIYFELAIKRDAVNVWGRNFQLGFYSVLMYLFLRNLEKHADEEGEDAIAKGMFRPFFIGWSPLAVVLSTGMACGGLLVALCIKYGDSILKTLAVSGSILLASVADHYILGGPLTVQMCIAGVVVIIAIINYAFDTSSAAPPAPPASKLRGDDAENSTKEAKNEKGDTKDDWQENETIEMRPLVKTREAANRRTNVPV